MQDMRTAWHRSPVLWRPSVQDSMADFMKDESRRHLITQPTTDINRPPYQASWWYWPLIDNNYL